MPGCHIREAKRLIIFTRDDWKCCLCGKMVLPRGNGPRFLWAEIDHILSMEKLGRYDNDVINLETVHHSCNVQKDRTER